MLTSWFMLLVTTENCVLLRYPHFVFIFGYDFKCCLCYCLLFLVYINKSTTLPLGTKTILAVWFRNRLTIAGLEQVLSHTEKSCIATYYKQFSTNLKIKIVKLIPVFLARAFVPCFNLIILFYYTRKADYFTMQ